MSDPSTAAPDDTTAAGELLLEAGSATASVHPHAGGRLGQLSVDGTAYLRGPEHAGEGWTAWGSYPLVPWSNRIPDGIVETGAGSFEVPINLPGEHAAIHGLGAEARWDVTESDARSAELRVGLAAGDYDVTAHQRFELYPTHLDHALAVTNEADRPVPAGLGFHPWFVAAPIQVLADAYWPGDTPLPDGPPLPVIPEVDLRLTRHAPSMDRCYTRLTDNIATVGDLTLSWSGPITQVVVFSGVDGWVCVEPVTMANDGFNMWAAGFADTGVRVIGPGESLQVRMRIGWRGSDTLRG